MFEIIPSPDNVVAFALTGRLDAGEMRQYQAAFAGRLASQSSLGVCVDITGLSDITAAGAVAGAKADLDALRHVRQFTRLAIVSDKEWPGVLVGAVASLMPTLEAQVFAPDQREQAVHWAGAAAAAVPVRSPEAGAGAPIRFIATSKPGVIAFEIDGLLTAESMAGVVETVEARIAANERISLLANITRFGGFEPGVLAVDGLLAMKLHAMKKLDRYAIVGAPAWMATIANAVAALLPGGEIRTFDATHEAEAWDWVGARRA